MHERASDAILNRMNKIRDQAIKQVSIAPSLQTCTSIYIDAKRKMMEEISNARRSYRTGVISYDDYRIIIYHYYNSLSDVLIHIRDRMMSLLTEEVSKLISA